MWRPFQSTGIELVFIKTYSAQVVSLLQPEIRTCAIFLGSNVDATSFVTRNLELVEICCAGL